MADFELKLLDNAQDGLPKAGDATSTSSLPPALRRPAAPMSAQSVSRIVCLSTGTEDDLEPLIALALSLLDLGYPSASVIAYPDMAPYVQVHPPPPTLPPPRCIDPPARRSWRTAPPGAL